MDVRASIARAGRVDGPGGFSILMVPCVPPCITIMRIIGSAQTGPLAARMPG